MKFPPLTADAFVATHIHKVYLHTHIHIYSSYQEESSHRMSPPVKKLKLVTEVMDHDSSLLHPSSFLATSTMTPPPPTTITTTTKTIVSYGHVQLSSSWEWDPILDQLQDIFDALECSAGGDTDKGGISSSKSSNRNTGSNLQGGGEAGGGGNNNDELDTWIQKASMSWLQLKRMQQPLLQQIQETQRTLKEQARTRNQQELQLANLFFSQHVSQQSIRTCQTVATPQLLKLCRGELQREAQLHPGEDAIARGGQNDDCLVVQQFFQVDPKDPQSKTTILNKLQSEISIRTTLEAELKNRQLQTANLKQTLVAKRKLLNELPIKLHDIERASIPLQKFCQHQWNNKKLNNNDNSNNNSLQLLSTQRRARLDMAQNLPKPLYTLFYQLQSYLDTRNIDGDGGEKNTGGGDGAEGVEADTMTWPQLEVRREESPVVILHCPLPILSADGTLTSPAQRTSSKLKLVSVAFSYDSDVDLVTAHVSNDQDLGKALIEELFPGDTGDEWVKAKQLAVKANSSKTTDERQTVVGIPYSWCNYLAGLHVTSPDQRTAYNSHRSTKIVIQTLERRIRSAVVLNHLLHRLSTKPQIIPIHSAWKQRNGAAINITTTHEDNPASSIASSVSLSSWTEDLESTTPCSNVRSFHATLQSSHAPTLTSTLSVKVQIPMARYPAIPPTWMVIPSSNTSTKPFPQPEEFSPDSPATITTPLYDSDLVSLERRINEDIDQLIVPSDETTYDWILSHQLLELMQGWERLLMQRKMAE